MTDAAANRPLRIFLCHASNDKPTVRDLHRRLTADGFAPWLDEEDLLPGQHWQVEIPKAVRESDVVLVCLSQHSINKTGYVQKEIKFALDVADEQPEGTIFLIPLRLEECNVPERLNHLQWINFYDEGGYARLLRALRRRAVDLNAATSAVITKPAPPVAPGTSGPPVGNIGGGVKVDANSVTVGTDVVGRDNITQTTFNIGHATIIQSRSALQEIKPTVQTSSENRRIIGGLEFVRIPSGKFLMGSKGDNLQASDNERPQHTVEIPHEYWIARFPVTKGQFAEFATLIKYYQAESFHPVVNVSWHEAIAYCVWLNNFAEADIPSQGLVVRLPTEAEWEKAARGERGNEWPWGNSFDKNRCNSFEGAKGGTMPVNTYSPYGDSPYGVADMVGNVWEWCHSIFKPYPYRADDGRELESGTNARVLRGGAFLYDQRLMRVAYRYSFDPIGRSHLQGFRVVIAPPLP